MAALPSGTVTFLFTDLEGSTRLWDEQTAAMHDALSRHDELVRGAIESHRGHVVKTTGDGFHAAFATAQDAVEAAVAAQLELGSATWPTTGPLRARMGIDSGPAESRDGDYYGPVLNRAARLMSIAHGGQIVLSLATRELLDSSAVDLDEAIPAGEEALAIARRLQAPSRVAFAAALLASRVAEQDVARAEALFDEARTAGLAAGNEWVDYVTSQALVRFSLTTGNHRMAADVALGSIDRSVAQRVPGHVLQWVGTLALLLATVDDEGALVLATWGEQRGLAGYEATELFMLLYGAETIAASRDSFSAAELERITATASSLTEAGIARYARERVELLPE